MYKIFCFVSMMLHPRLSSTSSLPSRRKTSCIKEKCKKKKEKERRRAMATGWWRSLSHFFYTWQHQRQQFINAIQKQHQQPLILEGLPPPLPLLLALDIKSIDPLCCQKRKTDSVPFVFFFFFYYSLKSLWTGRPSSLIADVFFAPWSNPIQFLERTWLALQSRSHYPDGKSSSSSSIPSTDLVFIRGSFNFFFFFFFFIKRGRRRKMQYEVVHLNSTKATMTNTSSVSSFFSPKKRIAAKEVQRNGPLHRICCCCCCWSWHMTEFLYKNSRYDDTNGWTSECNNAVPLFTLLLLLLLLLLLPLTACRCQQGKRKKV